MVKMVKGLKLHVHSSLRCGAYHVFERIIEFPLISFVSVSRECAFDHALLFHYLAFFHARAVLLALLACYLANAIKHTSRRRLISHPRI